MNPSHNINIPICVTSDIVAITQHHCYLNMEVRSKYSECCSLIKAKYIGNVLIMIMIILLNISVSIDLLLCGSNLYVSKIVVSLILLNCTTYSSHQCSSKRPFHSSRSSEKRCRSLSYLARLSVSYFGAHPIVVFKS